MKEISHEIETYTLQKPEDQVLLPQKIRARKKKLQKRRKKSVNRERF